MMLCVQIEVLERAIVRDGEREAFRVRIMTERGARKPSQIVNTGRTFVRVADAELWANGAYSALRSAGVQADLEYVGDWDSIPAGGWSEASTSAHAD